jgi:hypothetical protein
MDMRFSVLGVAALLPLFLSGCTKDDGGGGVTGITTIGNTVAGTVVDTKGDVVVNAEVRLIGNAYNPVLDQDESGYHIHTTDDAGRYQFDSVSLGNYNIEAIHDGDASFTSGIRLETVKDGKANVPDAMLTKPGAITVIFEGAEIKIGSHYFIPGTTRFVRVDSNARRDGLITLRYVPAGLYSSLKYMLPGDTSGTNVLPTDYFQVVPNDTLVLSPYSPWKQIRKVTVNTTPTGANVTTNVTDFPVLLRLNAANFDFKKARKDGADVRFKRGGGTALPYSIQSWDSAGASAEVWVKLDTVFGNSGGQSFLVFSGNPDSVSESDGAAVFTEASGYNGLWHLDKPSDLQDETKGKATGINHGAESVPGVIGKGVHFQGAAWTDLPAKAFGGIGSQISISFWTSGDDTLKPQKADLFGGQDSGGFVQLRMHSPYGDSVISWSAGATDTTVKDKIFGSADTEAQRRGQWNQWTLTKNADKGEMKMYLNGKVWQTGTGKTRPINRIVSFILAYANSEAYSLDEFEVSHVTRTDDWVKLSYEIQKPGATAVTVGK